MQSVVSYPDRGPWGNNKYRGNMSGYLVKDIIEQYHLKQLSDYMVGGGTTEDVCRAKGIPGTFFTGGDPGLHAQLHRETEKCL